VIAYVAVNKSLINRSIDWLTEYGGNFSNLCWQIKIQQLIGYRRWLRKGKWTCIAPIVSTSTTKRSDADHTELPANTPHLSSRVESSQV